MRRAPFVQHQDRQPRSPAPPRCYNCNEVGHIISSCPKPRRDRGTCYQCGSKDHLKRDCPQRKSTPDSTTMVVDKTSSSSSPYEVPVKFIFNDNNMSCTVSTIAILDTGSPISLVKSKILTTFCISSCNDTEELCCTR